MINFDFTGIKTALRKFEENGKEAHCGKWTIANGGYDLWWEIYYEGISVLECVDGDIMPCDRGDIPKEEIQKLIDVVKSVYIDLRDDNASVKDFPEEKLKLFTCTISVTDGEQTETEDFRVEAESFEEAVAKVKSDLGI